MPDIIVGAILVLYLAVSIYWAIKMPPPKNVTWWRTMTQSSIFNFPGLTLLIVVGPAVLITSFFTGHLSESSTNRVHCKIWHGVTSCSIKDPTHSSGANTRINGTTDDGTVGSGRKTVRIPVKILSRAVLAIDDLSAKEVHGIIILSTFQDDKQQDRTCFPKVGVRHYFKGVSGKDTKSYVCTETRLDPSHDSNSHAEYEDRSLGVFTLTVDKTLNALSGFFGGAEPIYFYLEPVSILDASDQKAWDDLLDNS